MIYEASNYMEGIEDHFQADQLLFISVVLDPDPDLILATLKPITHQFDEYDTIRKKKKKYILKVDRSIVMLKFCRLFFCKVTMLSSSDLFFWAEPGSGSEKLLFIMNSNF